VNAIADGLFTNENPPRLIGGRSRVSGRLVFPCPADPEYEPYPLRRDGTLWSYTIQRYRPKSPPYAGPEKFMPWPVAYVALEGEIIVEARLANVAFDSIAIGMALEMIPVPLDPDAHESPHIPAFQPQKVAA
jgi:uncharacterized protein